MKLGLFMLGCVLTDNLVFGKLTGALLTDKATGIKGAALSGLLSTIIATICAIAFGALSGSYLYLILFAALSLILAQLMYSFCKNKLGAYSLPAVIGSLLLGIIANTGAGYLYGILAVLLTGIGYTVALILMAGVQERIAFSRIPSALKGLPASLITAGLMTLAFMGFTGLGL